MTSIDHLGTFYLGRRYDLDAGLRLDEPILYDSRDLTTHAVIVGMTGSGKTGLGIGLIEEAALDHIPVLAIDPKGDLANLLLTFPDLAPSDFRPWIAPEDAARAGVPPDAWAASRAELWSKGLTEWGQDGARIRRLREAADFAVYTPGSTAGLPISLLRSFAAPDDALRADAELYRESIQATATGLLTLLQIDADPLTSREHILISNVLAHAWDAGRDLDVAALIAAIQQPPFAQVGVMNVDTFFPQRDRATLAMRLNALLAAPGFQAWLEGEPLDADAFLHTATGRPRVSVFSIAHLSDAERMFFVSMLLAEVIAWMRRQPGTGSLRAILYIDELFGYMPPVANPASKALLLTLLKQARAFGLGLVLATQNPVDLDYKGLSNAGTWFIGRLQTERDKARLLDGLRSAGAGAGADVDRVLSALGKRVFLLHNVHDAAPAVFETRWVMSYLAGPLTREQIRTLMAPRTAAGSAPDVAAAAAGASVAAPAAAAEPVDAGSATRPAVPAEVRELFLPVRVYVADPSSIVYRPRIAGVGDVTYDSPRHEVRHDKRFVRMVDVLDAAVPVDWEQGEDAGIEPDALELAPIDGARFAPLPVPAQNAKNYAGWQRGLQAWVRTNDLLELYRSAALRATSRPGEDERAFRIRLQEESRGTRDAKLQQIRDRFASRRATLEERLRRAQQAVRTRQEQARQRQLDTVVSVGNAVLGAFLGRKKISSTSVSRVGTAARSAGRAREHAARVGQAEENVGALEAQLAELDATLEGELARAADDYDAQLDSLETIQLRPKATDVRLHTFGLVWAPYVRDAQGGLAPAWP